MKNPPCFNSVSQKIRELWRFEVFSKMHGGLWEKFFMMGPYGRGVGEQDFTRKNALGRTVFEIFAILCFLHWFLWEFGNFQHFWPLSCIPRVNLRLLFA